MRKPPKIVTIDPVEAVAQHNFKKAREMLCIKMGWVKEYSHHILKKDVDGGFEAHKKFIDKVTRLLAFNYDVHRRPNPMNFPRLWPSERTGSEPLRFPPEWKD